MNTHRESSTITNAACVTLQVSSTCISNECKDWSAGVPVFGRGVRFQPGKLIWRTFAPCEGVGENFHPFSQLLT